MQVSRIIEVSFLLVLVYLVLSNGSSFGQVVSSIGSVYSGSIKTLQGR